MTLAADSSHGLSSIPRRFRRILTRESCKNGVLKNAVPNFNIIREEPIKLPFWALILTLSSKSFSSIPLYPTGRPLAQGADRVPCGGHPQYARHEQISAAFHSDA